MTAEDKKRWAIDRLAQRQRELGRTPKKTDFDEVERSRIKAFLGPWPRALEAAGLKPPRRTPSPARQKHCRSKRPRAKPGGQQQPSAPQEKESEQK